MDRHLTQELADEFSVGAMDESAAEAVSVHISVCEGCARLVAESDRVAAALLLGVPRTPPSPELRKRVFRRAGIAKPAPLVWATRLLTAGTGIAAVVIAVAALTGMVSLRSQVRDLEEDNVRLQDQVTTALSQRVEIAALTIKLDDQAREALELQSAAKLDRDLLIALLSPESKIAFVYPTDASPVAIGRFIWDPEQLRAWFIASRLPMLEEGQTYQLWVDGDGTFISLGRFNADASGFARFQALIPQGIEAYTQAVVTIESENSDQRQGTTIFVANLRTP
jgi:anti-sigma-K factor RskA